MGNSISFFQEGWRLFGKRSWLTVALFLCVALMSGCQGCKGCDDSLPICDETTSLRVEFYSGTDAQGNPKPITDLGSNALINVGVYSTTGGTDPLNPPETVYPTYNGVTNTTSGTVSLNHAILKSDIVNPDGSLIVPPKVSIGFSKDNLCTSESCGSGRYYQYVPTTDMMVDYDDERCEVIVRVQCQRICDTCF